MSVDTLEACPPRQPGRPSSDAVSDRGYNMQVKSVGIFHVDLCLKFVRSMCAENEFELKKNRIDFALREEKVFFEKVVIVLQSEFRKFGWIPGEIRANPRTGLSFVIVGKLGIGHVQVVAANTCDPPFFESPEHL
jgi:hypothetical protein